MAFKPRQTDAERAIAERRFQDRVFDSLNLKSAQIEISFETQTGLTCFTATGYATRDGVERRFPIEITGDRIEAFKAGVLSRLQDLWDAECDAAFARRDAGLPNADTPDPAKIRIPAVVLGAFEQRHGAFIFHLARWAWKNVDGETAEGGWNPERAQVARAISA